MKHSAWVILCIALYAPAEAGRALEVLTTGQKKVSLTIGNDNYKNISSLERAGNDAKAIAGAMERIGFKNTVLLNADQRQMNRAINRFVTDISGGGVGVLFYAGHGVQIQNQNFLLPVDMESPQNEVDVQDQSVSLQTIQEKIQQANARFAMLVIDACRDNPFSKAGTRSIGKTRGLAMATAPTGQIVLFSAGANQQALDKLGPQDKNSNSLFTREFIQALNEPGLSVSEVLRKVRTSVIAGAKSVNHDQNPALYDQTDGDFYLTPPVVNKSNNSGSDPNLARIMAELAEIKRIQKEAIGNQQSSQQEDVAPKNKSVEKISANSEAVPSRKIRDEPGLDANNRFVYEISDMMWGRKKREYIVLKNKSSSSVTYLVAGAPLPELEGDWDVIYKEIHGLTHLDMSDTFYSSIDLGKTYQLLRLPSSLLHMRGWTFSGKAGSNIERYQHRGVEKNVIVFEVLGRFTGTPLAGAASPLTVRATFWVDPNLGRALRHEVQTFSYNGKLDHVVYTLE